jgi:hypothetical protein
MKKILLNDVFLFFFEGVFVNDFYGDFGSFFFVFFSDPALVNKRKTAPAQNLIRNFVKILNELVLQQNKLPPFFVVLFLFKNNLDDAIAGMPVRDLKPKRLPTIWGNALNVKTIREDESLRQGSWLGRGFFVENKNPVGPQLNVALLVNAFFAPGPAESGRSFGLGLPVKFVKEIANKHQKLLFL